MKEGVETLRKILRARGGVTWKDRSISVKILSIREERREKIGRSLERKQEDDRLGDNEECLSYDGIVRKDLGAEVEKREREREDGRLVSH